MTFSRPRITFLAAAASLSLATGALFASPVEPRHPATISGRALPFHSAAQDVTFRTLRIKWEQRLPLGGPVVSLGEGMVAASRTGIHVIDSGGHEVSRTLLDPAPEVLTLLGDGRLLAQSGSQVHGICLPISACRKPFTTQLPQATAGLPAIPLAGGGALLAAGTQLLAVDSDGRIWGTTDLGGAITALYAGQGAGYPGSAIVVVGAKNGARVRTFHPSTGAHTIAEIDGTITASAHSGTALYVAIDGTTLALVAPELRTAVPLAPAPGGIYAMTKHGAGVAALVGTQLGYSLLLATPLGSRQIPVEVLPNLDGGPPPAGLGYAAIASDSNGFIAFLTPSGALSMLTPDGSILRFPDRPCGLERLQRPPALAHMAGIGLVLACPSGRIVAFVSE